MPSVKLHQADELDTRELRQIDPRTEERLRELGAAAMPLHRLKRTGAAPLLFNGVTLATVCGVTPALPFWYEINLHRTVVGTFVSDVRLFNKSPDQCDLFRVAEHDSLDGAIERLSRYAPADDAVLPLELVRPASSAAELALGAARLQLQLAQLCAHFDAVLGDLLYALTPAD